MSVKAYERLPLDSQHRLDAVCSRFERAWAGLVRLPSCSVSPERLAEPSEADSGRRDHPNLLDHLADVPDSERDTWLTELLHVELAYRRRAGESPHPAEYYERLPNDTAVIDAVFAETTTGAVGVGAVVGKYRLTRLIGRGGMSSVYEADDPVIGRPVAVKLLTGRADAAQVTEEARLAGRLTHPNIVTVYEAGFDGGAWYMAMERLATSAAERVKQAGPFDPLTATRITADVCRGLAAAHAAGLVHRDIKPANVLLTGAEAPGTLLAKLSDFGLAHEAGGDVAVMTAGTPAYMPPEEFVGCPAGPPGDVYSLGATYYTLLTGRPPYEATTAAEAMAAHRDALVPNPRAIRSGVPASAARIVARAMAKNPARRYPDAGAMLVDLEAILNSPSRNVGLRRALVAAVVLAVASMIALAVALRPVTVAVKPQGEETETGWVNLFNGRDLSGWELFVKGSPPGGMFSIVEKDGEPAIHCSDTRFGTLTLAGEYENYHLEFEYRWESTEGKHSAGVRYHGHMPAKGPAGVMEAHELGIIAGNTGGYYKSFDVPLCDVAELRDGRPEPITSAGRKVVVRQKREFKTGYWNQVELVCVGDTALHVVNGSVVLALTRSRASTPNGEVPLTGGRLQLRSSQSEIYFRRIRIRPVTEIPARFHRMVAG
jgi:Protein kinase domain/Domain of Unknown Function (DUF1080)